MTDSNTEFYGQFFMLIYFLVSVSNGVSIMYFNNMLLSNQDKNLTGFIWQ